MGKKARLIFRKLMPEDAEDVAELDLKCFGAKEACQREYFFQASQDERREFWVVERKGKIIACASAEVDLSTAEIESLAVDPDYQRRGIGKIIFIKLIEVVRKRGVNFVLLEVRLSNKIAIELYKGLGFQIVERAKNFYRDEDAWIMARDFFNDNF